MHLSMGVIGLRLGLVVLLLGSASAETDCETYGITGEDTCFEVNLHTHHAQFTRSFPSSLALALSFIICLPGSYRLGVALFLTGHSRICSMGIFFFACIRSFSFPGSRLTPPPHTHTPTFTHSFATTGTPAPQTQYPVPCSTARVLAAPHQTVIPALLISVACFPETL
jgi:hypothetical protein